MTNNLTTTRTRSLRRTAAIALGVLGAVAFTVAAPAVADAHVEMAADSTAAGSSALLTLSVPHGCEGSATTRVAVRVPSGINTVTPTVNPGWKVTKTTERLAQPITDDDGQTLSTRVSSVVWTARTPLADGFRDTLSLQVQLPTDTVGRELSFPTVQTCTVGETAWTQVPAPGQDHDELNHPAPGIVVTDAAAGHDGDHGSAGHPSTATDAHLSAPTDDVAHGGGDSAATTVSTTTATTSRTGLAGVVLGALGLLAGGTALVRSRVAVRHDERG